MSTASNDMIEVLAVTKTFDADTPHPTRALDGVTLHIAPGEFVVVIGSNGSGKSTLLNVIAGSVLPDAGQIRIAGRDVSREAAYRRAGAVARVFQNPFSGTAPSMTVAENLRLAALRGHPKRWRVGLTRTAVDAFREEANQLGMGLEERMHTPIGRLSGGQRQALTLLMATLGGPGVLLLDEHTAALDPGSAEQVMRLTETLAAERNLTSMMVTHDMAEAARHGTRLVMMHAGRVAFEVSGPAKQALTPQALLERFEEIRTIREHGPTDEVSHTL